MEHYHQFIRWTVIPVSGTEDAYVDLRQGAAPRPPSYVEFVFSDDSSIRIHVASFQQIRRSIPLYDDGRENKIALIKLVRGLYDLCLRDAKLLVEWFLDRFTRDADSAPSLGITVTPA